MTTLLVGVLAVVLAFGLGIRNAPAPQVIIMQAQPAEPAQNGSSGCLSVLLVGVLLIIALVMMRL